MILGILHSFPIYLELTLHRQKTLVLYFNVSGTQTSTKSPGNLRASIFGRKKTCGRRKRANGGSRAKRGGAHAAWYCSRVGPTHLGLVAPLPSIFSPPTSSWPKNAYKKGPPSFSGRSAAETQKHRNRDLELQIGGGKLRRGAAGVVTIFSNDFSTVSMMKRE